MLLSTSEDGLEVTAAGGEELTGASHSKCGEKGTGWSATDEGLHKQHQRFPLVLAHHSLSSLLNCRIDTRSLLCYAGYAAPHSPTTTQALSLDICADCSTRASRCPNSGR